jgi:hypothetical protein
MARILLHFDSNDSLRQMAFRKLAAHRRIFSQLLELHRRPSHAHRRMQVSNVRQEPAAAIAQNLRRLAKLIARPPPIAPACVA